MPPDQRRPPGQSPPHPESRPPTTPSRCGLRHRQSVAAASPFSPSLPRGISIYKRKKIEVGQKELATCLKRTVGDLKEVVVHIQRDIKTVGDSMSIKMQYLQSTANDIANVVGKSLENHMQLLDGQSKAMVSLINL
uniref:DUF1664 domain-containing protein n=1 Tax=Oryza nivara TaxID=4536 RepID=A0A0E0IGD4_ORYNI